MNLCNLVIDSLGCSSVLIGKLNFVKISISSNLIYSFCVIPFKLPVDFCRYCQPDFKYCIDMPNAMKSQGNHKGKKEKLYDRYQDITQ